MSQYVSDAPRGAGYYWKSVYLEFPDQVIEQARGRKSVLRWTRHDSAMADSSGIGALVICRIPQNRVAAKLVLKYFHLQGTLPDAGTMVRQPDKSEAAPTISVEGPPDRFERVLDGSVPNDEGFVCMEGTDWMSYDQENCTDGQRVYLPEVPVEEPPPDPDDGSGGGGGGGAGTPDLPDGGNNGPINEPYPREDDGGSESVEQQLANLLEQDKFALLDVPCDEIPNWQALAQFTPPQSVIDKLENLDENYTSIISGDWNVEYIQDAAGTLINMDYFPVTVNQLPNNPDTGQPFTADGFLEYIRTNLDDFFEGNSTEFGPYNSTENQIWQSDNYLGAIMRFEITPMVGLSQDGSVISSAQSEQSWNFTTIESPADWNHPVSGTRKFGVTQNGDGSYTFYIRGVDRITETTDEFIGNYTPAPSAFEGADALWNTFKDDVYGFVENHGGNAQLSDTSDNSIWRPNWDEVSDIIMNTGSRTVSDLGCN